MALPKHIAIIMDGNGRWATKRGLVRTAGHKAGAENLKKVLSYAQKKGVEVVTLFAFSSENWSRPADEVKTLMNLFRSYLKNDIHQLAKQGIRVSFIGNREKFDADLQEQMAKLEKSTESFTNFHVVLALSYGARDDLVLAAKRLAHKVQQGALSPDDITPAVFEAHLSTAGIIAPDLLIRTSGEERISNFLLWEIAYAELYFSPVFWPDFDEKEFDKALSVFEQRQRRFGGLSA